MLSRVRKAVAATIVSSTLVLGVAPTAMAQQSGLVNVEISGTNVIVSPQVEAGVQVPVGIAANVCGVNVAVLATLISDGTQTCDSTVNQRTEAAFRQIQRIVANANG